MCLKAGPITLCQQTLLVQDQGQHFSFSAPSLHFIYVTCMRTKLLQSCPTLCDPRDWDQRRSSVHGIQARILEWAAMPSSRASSQPKDQTCVSCLLHWQIDSYHWCHLGSSISVNSQFFSTSLLPAPQQCQNVPFLQYPPFY